MNSFLRRRKMAVGSSTEKKDTTSVQKQRESDYQRQIEEQEKRHKNEITALRKRYAEDMRNASNANDRNLTTMRTTLNTAITEKDNHYQKEINRLQEAYKNRNRSIVEDYEQKLSTTKTKADNDIRLNQETSKNQREILVGTYDTQLKQMDREYRDYVNSSKESQDVALDGLRKELLSRAELEKNTFREYHTDKVSSLDKNLQETRRVKDNENKQLRKTMDAKTEHMGEAFKNTIERDRAFHDQALEASKVSHKIGLDAIKSKYHEALQDNTVNQEFARDTFEDNVLERINAKERKLEIQLDNEKRKNVISNMTQKQVFDSEKKVIQAKSSAEVAGAEEHKNLAIRGLKNEHIGDLRKLQSKFDDAYNNQAEFYQGNIDTIKEQNRANLSNQITGINAQKEQTQNQSELRVRQILNQKNQDEASLREYFKDNLEIMKDQNQKDLRNQRADIVNKNKESIARLHNQIQEMESKHNVQMETLRSKYEARLKQMDEMSRRSEVSIKKNQETTIEGLKKQHEREKEEISQKMTTQLEAVKKQQDEVIDRMEKRHQKVVKDLISQKS